MSLQKTTSTRYVPAVAPTPGQPYSHTCPPPPPRTGGFVGASGGSSGGAGNTGGCAIIPVPTGNGGIYYWNTCVDH